MSTEASRVPWPRRIDVLRDRQRQELEERIQQSRKQVLKLICLGLSRKHIARQLGISVSTVKLRLEEWREISGTESREQLAIWAVVNGHFHPDQEFFNQAR